jgi:hypothetical protein
MSEPVSPFVESAVEARPLKREAAAVSCAFGLAGGVLCLAALHLGPEAGIAVAAIAAAIAAGTSHALGVHRAPPPDAIRLLLLHVAGELAQYRVFTRLVRDQGHSITGTTASAASSLAVGLAGMGGHVDRLVTEIEQGGATLDRDKLIRELHAIGEPLMDMLGTLQFQDVSRQQIEFLSHLSLILDDHMLRLSARLGDRKLTDRTVGFRETLEQALKHCVMADQRNDHHAALGMARREEVGLKVELF